MHKIIQRKLLHHLGKHYRLGVVQMKLFIEKKLMNYVQVHESAELRIRFTLNIRKKEA